MQLWFNVLNDQGPTSTLTKATKLAARRCPPVVCLFREKSVGCTKTLNRKRVFVLAFSDGFGGGGF